MSAMSDPIWITEAEVVGLMDLPDAISALDSALRAEAKGDAQNMTKTLMQYGKSNLHAIGARLDGLVGTKTWAHTEGGTCPLLLLWDAQNGSLLAVIEAFALGNMRTGGISGVAANWLADPAAKVMGLVGTGKQALSQMGTMLAVRPIERVQVFGPSADKRAAFVARAREEFGVDVLSVTSVEAACKGAQIVTLVTRATQPVLTAAMLAPGTHLNAVGAIAPDREEFTQDVFARVSAVAVDNLAGVQQLSREFKSFYGSNDSDKAGWDKVPALAQLIAAGRRRMPQDDITLFKAMGMGISDLALGTELLKRARAGGIGRNIPQPKKTRARLARKSVQSAA